MDLDKCICNNEINTKSSYEDFSDLNIELGDDLNQKNNIHFFDYDNTQRKGVVIKRKPKVGAEPMFKVLGDEEIENCFEEDSQFKESLKNKRDLLLRDSSKKDDENEEIIRKLRNKDNKDKNSTMFRDVQYVDNTRFSG